jgi:EAL domain-containing protein (putative c-di-GMP-specific phosphodiesterase class I)
VTQETIVARLCEPGSLTVVFQPIFALRDGAWRAVAVESLVRGPAGTNMARADVMFEYLRRKGEEQRFDRVCVALALAAARDLPGSPRVALNVHASTLSRDPDFGSFLEATAVAAEIEPSRLVIEIIEHAPCHDLRRLARALLGVREFGARVALDDIGLGQSNYRMILECRPEFYKIDRFLVAGVAADPYRRSVLRSIAELADGCGAGTVAEGVETAEDLAAVVETGITMVQGFLLGRPRDVGELRSSGIMTGSAAISEAA